MPRLNFLAAIILLVLVGCASASKELSPEGKIVKLMKADPAENCEELGSVWGEKQTWEDEDAAKNRLRNKAAMLGATYVRMEMIEGTQYDSTSSYYKLKGTAFRCP